MGFDNECILNLQSLKGEYFCPVCRLLVYPNEALQSQCSHLYCKPCLTYVVRTTQACPYDGYLVTEADSKPLLESNKVLADTIGNIPVHCLFHRSGCTWQGKLTDCTTHCSGCAFGDSLVVCNRCGVQIVHRQVQEHAQSCHGVPSQASQPDNGQVSSGATLNAPLNQNQTVAPASTPASQDQTSQASVTSAAAQNSTQHVIPATQAQAAQSAMPNAEQWYQQQQQYQQYYQQQYLGYDPYQQQQQYQQYYPYQQQAVQQTQQPVQVYASQVPVQQQPQPQSQFQSQPQAVATHTSQQPQQLYQAPIAAQPQPHPPQATSNIQQQIQPAGQPQALQNQVAYSVLQSQPQAYSQVQPYAHPQTVTQAVPQQGMQMPQYQQTRPQMQPSHPQGQTQPYSQPQGQQYAHPQSHLPAGPAQGQTIPHPISHIATRPPLNPTQPINHAAPRNPTQPMNHAAPLQAQLAPAHTVTGYQSYQQPQPLRQTQAGAPHASHMNGLHQQPLNPGQFPQQPTQMRPPHIPAGMPNQQQPTIVPPQVQNIGGAVAQGPAYSHSQYPGYPIQHHSGLQPIQHASAQPQGFPEHVPYLQQRPVMQAPVRAQAAAPAYQQNNTQPQIQPNVRSMISHGGGQQPYSQAPGIANAAHLLPTQPSTTQQSVNQSYPSLLVHGQELLKPSAADRPGASNTEQGKQEQNNVELGSGNLSGVGTAESSNPKILEPKPLVGTDAKSHVFENGTSQKGNMKTQEENMDNATQLPSDSKSADVANEDCKENEQHSDKVSSTTAQQFAKQAPGSHSTPSSDLGRNQWHHGPSPQHKPAGPMLPQSVPGQLRPQVSAQMHPSHSVYGRGPGSAGLPHGHFNQDNFPVRPPFVSPPPPGTHGGMMGGIHPDFPEGSVRKPQPPNPMEGPGFSDGRQHEIHPHGPMEQRPFGQTSSLHRLQDERMNMLPEEHLKPFSDDHSFGRRDFEGDLKKFPRPSHLDGGTPGKFGPRFPLPGPLDQGPHMFGDRLKLTGFHDVRSGRPDYPDFPRPGFVHHGSPGRDLRAVPTLGGFPGGIDGNKTHSYPLGKAIQESRFPELSGHLQRGEFNAPVNIHGSNHLAGGPRKHSRAGDAIGQDMLHIHSRRGDFGPYNVHSREPTGPGAFRGHLEMGEPPFPGSYLPPRPFAESFGRDMPGYLHPGEPGFRSSYHLRHAYDDGFYRGEMEPFDNPRKRKPGGIMCRICNVDCGTVEGLDLHSQTREHQKKSMDMVISIKQQYSKKQKVSNERSVLEEGRKNRTASFEGHGKKR